MDASITTVDLGSFSERLRRLRSSAGISQDELARRSGLSAAGVGALERGTRRAPQRETLALLADALGLSERERSDLDLAAQRGRARIRTRTADAPVATHNLPFQLTSFVGRADQIERIAYLLDAYRLVTVLGSGGVGKTRAALEVAMRVAEDGREEVRFVDLAPLQDGALIVSRIASVLGVHLPSETGTPESLALALKVRRVLLILDNCEHLIAGATEIARALLQHCLQIRILTTTRERLGIMGEAVHRLPPLAIPDDNPATIAAARSSSAVELFMQRGLSADPDLTFADQQTPALIDVCRRLEGIPLAIEIAAAQLPALGIETLSRRLEASLGAARSLRGLPNRQQTMRETIAWSYDLLLEPERLLLQRLSVFAGGCTLAAAEIVCPHADLEAEDVAGRLASLVDKSLVDAVLDGENMRYTLLDSTRAFARERLARDGHEPELFRRHARWLAAYGETALSEFSKRPNLVWLDEFWPELDNVRSALGWTLHSQNDDDVQLAGRIAGSFRGLWLIPGLFQECRHWIELVLSRVDEKRQPLVVANLLTALMQTLAGPERLAVHARLIEALRYLDDRPRLAAALSSIAVRYCRAGFLTKAQNAIDDVSRIQVEDRKLESPTRESEQRAADLAIARAELGMARGEFDEARAHIQEATVITRRLGDEFVLNNLSSSRAEIEFLVGDISLAAAYSAEAARGARAIPRGSALLARALCLNAAIRLSTPEGEGGETAAREAFRATSSIGDDALRLISLQNLAARASRRGRPHAAARFLGSLEAWRSATGYHRSAFEEATYRILRSSLHARLGAELETLVAQGGGLTLELATGDVLAID